MRQTFHIIENSGACCRETRHRLEECVREIGYVAAYEEWQGAEETEQSPCQCDNKKGIASAHSVGCVLAEIAESETEHLCD